MMGARSAFGTAVSMAAVLASALGVAGCERGGGSRPGMPAAQATGGAAAGSPLQGRPKEEFAPAVPKQSDLPEGWTLSTKNPMDELAGSASAQSADDMADFLSSAVKFTPQGCDFGAEKKKMLAIFGGSGSVGAQGSKAKFLGYAEADPPGADGSVSPMEGDRVVQAFIIDGMAAESEQAKEELQQFIAKCSDIHGEMSIPGGGSEGRMSMDISWKLFDPPSAAGEKALGITMVAKVLTAALGQSGGKAVKARGMMTTVRGVMVSVFQTGQDSDQDDQLADKLYTLTAQRVHDLP